MSHSTTPLPGLDSPHLILPLLTLTSTSTAGSSTTLSSLGTSKAVNVSSTEHASSTKGGSSQCRSSPFLAVYSSVRKHRAAFLDGPAPAHPSPFALSTNHVGCSAGFLNVPKIKGTHTAMKSGIVAADAVFDSLTGSEGATSGTEVTQYEADMRASWVWDELRSVRNYHPSFKAGLWPGVLYSGLSAFVLRGREPWTFKSHGSDAAATRPAAEYAPIDYPRPDGVLSFDLLANLARSGTSHEGDQPSHLRIKPGMEAVPTDVSLRTYGAPESRFCPARVYEYPDDKEGKLVINAQNCIHCKTCDIKTPQNYIKWTVPEAGGGGPSYESM